MKKPKKEVKVEGYLKKEILNPKNQAALEFLMTYGWAILVVLVSIGSLSYFGVLSPDRFLPVKCTLQPGIACLDHKATAASLIVNVQNSLGRDITVDRVTAAQCTELPSQGILANNAQIILTFPSCTNPGTKYHGQFNITYTAIGTSIQHTNQGEITTRIEGQTTLSNITPDTTPPAVSVTAPADGATVSGTIAVSATASDNVAVVGVQFRLDGANLGLEDLTSPYSISWNTATATNGAHSLTAVARDAAGNTATSAAVSVTVSNVDTTPPSISAVTTSAVTTTTATITWATNEPADTQVEYGLTTSYGSSTALNATLVTSHSQTISGLSSSTLYHYRVLSRDAAGNLGTSGDFNFTTASAADTIPPTISITSPSNGATVSGTIAVSATASDNVAVVGVQFRLDGANLGAEDLTAPYSISWDTATASNGAHSLTAVARDAAGNTATSAAVSVTVSNIISGLVGYWPFDEGSGTIANDASGNGNTGTLVNGPTWTTGKIGQALDFDGINDYVDVASPDLPTANFTYSAWIRLNANTDETIVMATDGAGGNEFILYVGPDNKLQVGTQGTAFTSGATSISTLVWTHVVVTRSGSTITLYVNAVPDGTRSDGTAFSFSTCQLLIGVDADSTCAGTLGNYLNGLIDEVRIYNRALTLTEIQQLANVPPPETTPPNVSITSPSSGATVNGTIFVNATASDNVGVVGVQFRLDGANLGAEDLVAPYSISWNTATATNGAHSLTAVARDAAGNTAISSSISVTVSNIPDTTAPTVSITAPADGATVSGTTAVSATASDNVAVVGVQFRLNGSNLGLEDTTAPYSVSWDTTLVTNGTYTLTAVARDATGNTAISAGVTVIVSNVIPPPPSGNFHYVRTGATGNGNGSDWTNAFTCPPSSGSYSRGDTIWVAAGNYQSCSTWNLDKAVSGSALVTIKSATAAAHGSDTGWDNSYAGQAVFREMVFTTSNWMFDGVTGGGPGAWKTGFGFKVLATAAGSIVRVQQGDNITLQHVDIQGRGVTCTDGNRLIHTSATGPVTNFTIRYSYLHDVCGVPIFTRAGRDMLFEYVWVARDKSTPTLHSEGISAVGTHNVIVRSTVWEDIEGTCSICFEGNGWELYGNVFFFTPAYIAAGGAGPDSTPGTGNGAIATWTSSAVNNAQIYNNVFINFDIGVSSRIYFDPAVSSNNVARNNIWVSSARSANHQGVTLSHNSYWDTTTTDSGTGSQSGLTGDPLVDWVNENFRLSAATTAGMTLPAPYNIDPDGKTRGADGTWDRGAYEFP